MKLTWDDDDPERQQITRRKFSRKEIEEDNFRAYIASSSESESEARPEKSKQKSQSRDKLRALLLAGNDNDMPEGWGGNGNDEGASDVDMEITFTPGLSESKGEEDETTIEKYKRKMKEKRKQRKEERNAPKEVVEDKDVDDFFEADTEEDDEADDEEDDNEPVAVAPIKKSVTFKTQTKTADIDLVPDVGADGDDKKHFDLKAILRAEKGKGKIRHKKKKAETSTDETQPDFSIDVTDNRFSVLHEDPNFAIDPSNPQYVLTAPHCCFPSLTVAAGSRRRKQCQRFLRKAVNDGIRSGEKTKCTSLRLLKRLITRRSASWKASSKALSGKASIMIGGVRVKGKSCYNSLVLCIL